MQFDDINYLKNGTAQQQKACEVLEQYELLKKLGAFDPILVGTIPINIDIETSDLDIICHFEDKERYIKIVMDLFNHQKNFSICNEKGGAVIVHFIAGDFEIEIFAQNIPTRQQAGYRHMVVEYHLLNKYGETFRQQIIELKKQGYKTEPAFAKLLNLDGDPYLELLKLEFPAQNQ